MKKRFTNPNIVLIRSPYVFPGSASEGWKSLISVLESLTRNLHISDAAADYYNAVLMGGDSEISDPRLLFADFHRSIFSAGDTPLALIDNLSFMDSVLEAASRAYHPCRFHRHGFTHPALSDIPEVMRFASDRQGNPFYHFAFDQWQPCGETADMDMALLFVDQAGQMAPAATLAAAWRRRWPQTPIKLLGPVFSADRGQPAAHGNSYTQWPFEFYGDREALTKDLAAIFSFEFEGQGDALESIYRPAVPVGTPMKALHMPSVIETAGKTGIPLMVWRDCGDETDRVSGHLYDASRQGLWNHLILHDHSSVRLEKFAAANSNIIHSYCHEQKPSAAFNDPTFRFPSSSPPYGRTTLMPGKPLWMGVQDPTLTGLLLAHHSPKALMRLRIREDNKSLFEVGGGLAYHFQRPEDLPDGYLGEIVRMVEAGGSVNTQFVHHNLERAYLIAYVLEEGVIIGNSSLKHPRKEYIDAVSGQAGIDLHDYLERGYTSVRPEYRGMGVGVKLLEGLTKRAGEYKIFSVIAESNIATQKMAMRNRTRRVATFFSQRAKKEMSVWIPEWMLPAGIDLPAQPELDVHHHDRGKS